MKEHDWIRTEDPSINHEFTCSRCGRVIIIGVPEGVDWISFQPSQRYFSAEMRRSAIEKDCDLEKVRQVMES